MLIIVCMIIFVLVVYLIYDTKNQSHMTKIKARIKLSWLYLYISKGYTIIV